MSSIKTEVIVFEPDESDEYSQQRLDIPELLEQDYKGWAWYKIA
jgi:hypothetical protein